MFIYISGVSTGYTLLISICPILKARKIKSIASSAIFSNLFKNYFRRVQKYGGFLLNCTKVSLTVFDSFLTVFVKFSTVDTVNRF